MGATVFFNGSNELATLSNAFSVGGTPTNPTDVTLVVTDPTLTATPYAIGDLSNPQAGTFTKDIPCTSAGLWTYVWTGTGAATDVQPGSFFVHSVNFTPLYCTPEQLKSGKGITDNLDDAEILDACESVSRWIDEHCDRVFARRSAVMRFEPCGQYSLEVPDLVSVTSLKVDADGDGVFETTWSASDYQLRPVNAAVELQPKPYTEIAAVGAQTFPTAVGRRRERVEVTGVWGWPSLPAPVRRAARILAGDYLKLEGMSFGVQGYGDYGAVRARLSTPSMAFLDKYRRNPILVA